MHLNVYFIFPEIADSSCLVDIRIFWIGSISRHVPIVTLFEDLFYMVIETYLS